jgi:LysM repeat protein
MKKTRSYILIVLFLLVIVSLTACVKNLPAPKTEKTKAAKATEQPTEMIDTIYQFATQTAQAALAQPQPQTTPQATAVVPAATQVVVEVVPTATLVPAVIPTLAIPATYTMKKYEFIYCIARRFNVNPAELMALNGLNQYSVINPGQVLRIPQTGNPFPFERALRAHPVSYTVIAGDTIYKIACLFGDVDPLAIAAVNGLTAPYGLNIGQVLNIP